IERSEFLARFRKVDPTLSRAQIAEHFKNIDDDSDGKLTLVELMAKSQEIEDMRSASKAEM
ncbi:hypothetical protein T484DRAFT_1824627, partial [Baffinella frigidus]